MVNFDRGFNRENEAWSSKYIARMEEVTYLYRIPSLHVAEEGAPLCAPPWEGRQKSPLSPEKKREMVSDCGGIPSFNIYIEEGGVFSSNAPFFL